MREKSTNLKSNKAITLIALVITIIVLLILAGVTIATLTGDNGLLTKAGEAKRASEIAGEKETVELAVIKATSESNYGKLEEQNLKNALEEGSTVEQKEKNFLVTF